MTILKSALMIVVFCTGGAVAGTVGLGGGMAGARDANPDKNKDGYNTNDNGFRGGNSATIQGWKPADLETIKGVGKPICIYIYDAADRNNNHAKLLEGLSCLANVDVKEKLQAFHCVKIKSDASDAKGWPAEWLRRAKAGAALFLFSEDFTQIQILDKNSPREAIRGQNIVALMDGILKYDEQKKALSSKKDEKKDGDKPAKKVLGF